MKVYKVYFETFGDCYFSASSFNNAKKEAEKWLLKNKDTEVEEITSISFELETEN